MAKTPYLDAVKLTTVLVDGGFLQSVTLSQASNLLLLSGLHILRMRWLWQNPISPISDALYNVILEFVEEAEAQLMINSAIGSIFPSVAVLTDDSYLLLIGQTVLQSDYPILSSVVPASWLVGSNIQLPDMRDTFVQGALTLADFGAVEGENTVTLTTAEMPSHTHAQNPHSHSDNTVIDTPLLAVPGPEPVSFVLPTITSTGPSTAINQNSGGDQPHNNVPLSLQVAWYIIAR